MLHTIALALMALLASSQVLAFDGSPCPRLDEAQASTGSEARWDVFFSPFTHHWSRDPEHRPVRALSVSRLLPNDRFCGASLFTNSFGQPSGYAFTGWTWPQLFDAMPRVYGTVSAGIIYGYVGSYKNKVPLNMYGFSPVIIPAIGYRISPHVAVEVQVLGNAAVMFGSTVRF